MRDDAVMSTEFDVEKVVDDVAARLRAQFPDRDPDQIEAVVREEVDQLRQRPVTDYVAVLSTKAARKRLKAD